MRDLDETDLAILGLLLEDSRRPFREIAEKVDLSPPAVSDRIDRLHEHGIIRRFTVDVDRTKLQDRIPVLIELDVDPGAVELVFAEVLELDGVEHAFQRFDGTVLAHANAPERDVNAWLRSSLDLEPVRSCNVTLVANYEWTPDVTAPDFVLTCPVCDGDVTGTGETARVDGEVLVFCCPTCKSQYVERHERHSEAIE